MRILAITFITSTASAQDLTTAEISLDLNNASIRDALTAIQQQSRIKFVYGADVRNYGSVKVSIREKNITVKEAIGRVLKGTNLRYIRKGDHILIDERPAAGPVTPAGQPGTGSYTLKGRVVDFETAAPLPGASVRLEGMNKAVVSDEKGYYTLSGIRIGEYILSVTYTGYSLYRELVKVHASGSWDVKMQAGSSTLSEVVISNAGRKVKNVTHSTEKAVIAEIRAANGVVSGISNELINKMADRNAAEIVKRISGVTVTDDRFIVVRGMNARYNQTYLNGNLAPSTELYTHAFAFDLLPSPIVDRILVYKSPTPDLSGDVTGGSVKIFTKNARPVRHFDIGVQTGYRTTTTFREGNTYRGGRLDWLGFDDGTRNKASSALPGFADSYGKAPLPQQRMQEAFSPDLQIGKRKMNPDFQAFVNYFDNFQIGKKARLYNFTMLNYTSENRIQEVYRQTGNLYSMSFGSSITKDANQIVHAAQSTEKGRINAMENLLLEINKRHSIEFKNFFLNEGNKNTSVSVSQQNQLPKLDTPLLLRGKNLLESFEQRTLYSGNLTGNHSFGNSEKHHLRWNLGYNHYQQNIPDQRNMRFYGQNGFLVAAGSNNSSYQDVYLGMINRIFITNREENYQASLDYSFTLNPLIKLTAGGSRLFKNRKVDRRFFQVNRAGLEGVNPASFEFADYGIHDNFGWSDPNLIRFTEADLGKVWSPAFFRPDGKGLAVYDATQPTDNYVADEGNTAAYIMGDIHLLNKRLNLIGGLRMEDDRQRLSAAIVENGAFVPLLLVKPLTVWLPSVNATYTMGDSAWVLRAGYGKTLNRPEFREISPFNDYDFMNDVTIQGNPRLVTARIDNYDLRLEWYPRNHAAEMISAGVFYKHLRNPIEQIRNDQSGAVNFMPTNLSYWNADKAEVYGAEAEIRKSLSFLPGAIFRNLSVVINAALIKSAATKAPATKDSSQYDFYSSFRNRQLQGQAPYVLNAGLFYENPGWGLKTSVTYNVSGTTIYAVSAVSSKDAKGPATLPNGQPTSSSFVRPNLIELPRHQLDFSLTQRLFKSLNAKLSVQNLLDNAVRIAEDQNYDNKYTAEKITGMGQISGGTGTGPIYQGDNIFRRVSVGRYFLLSFTYAF